MGGGVWDATVQGKDPVCGILVPQRCSAVAIFACMYRYQSLEAWKRAHAAAVLVLRSTDAPAHPKCREVFSQLRRAVISVEANIVEGYALGTADLYRRHLRIALGSAAEAECLIRLSRDVNYLTDTTAKEIESILGNAMRALHGLLRRSSVPRGQPAPNRPTSHTPRS